MDWILIYNWGFLRNRIFPASLSCSSRFLFMRKDDPFDRKLSLEVLVKYHSVNLEVLNEPIAFDDADPYP